MASMCSCEICMLPSLLVGYVDVGLWSCCSYGWFSQCWWWLGPPWRSNQHVSGCGSSILVFNTPTFYLSICRWLVVFQAWFVFNCCCGVVSARSPVFCDVSFQSLRVYSIHIRVVALLYDSRCQLTCPCSAFHNNLWLRAPFGVEIPDQEIAHSSFCRKLRNWRFRFEERREGVAAAR